MRGAEHGFQASKSASSPVGVPIQGHRVQPFCRVFVLLLSIELAGPNVEAATILFSDDFSTNKGWTGYETDYWERGPATAGYGDPSDDHSTTSDNYLVGVNIGGGYPSAVNGPHYLTSPTINCSGRTAVKVTFWRWLWSSGTSYGHHWVEVYDGSTWQRICLMYDTYDSFWHYRQYDVSKYAANNANFKVRFKFESLSEGNSIAGWSVDDVEVSTMDTDPNAFTDPDFEADRPEWVLNNSGVNFYGYRISSAPLVSSGDRGFGCWTTGPFPIAAGSYYGIAQNVDLTNVATIVFDARYLNGSHLALRAKIDGAIVWSTETPGTYLNQILDVSGYTGTHTVQFEFYVVSGGTFDIEGGGFDNIRTSAGAYVDTSPPTVAHVFGDGFTVQPAGGWNAYVWVTFSEAVAGVDVSDLILTGSAAVGASVAEAQNGGSNEWVFVLSGLVGGTLNFSLAPDSNDIEDGAGNDLSPRPTTWSYTVVDPPPTVTYTFPEAASTIVTSTVNVEVWFSEAVFGVDASDMVLSGSAAGGATVGPVTDMGSNVWKFPLSGFVNGTLNISLAPAANDIEDSGGNDLNPRPTMWSYTITVDTTPPTVTAKSPAADSTVTWSSPNVEVTFSEPVWDVDASDLVLSGSAAAGATVGAVMDLGSNTWRFPVSGLVNGGLTVSLAPGLNDIEDINGNDLSPRPTSWSYTVALAAREDFETGDFSKFPWTTPPWGINWQITSGDKQGGTYSAQAGMTFHQSASTLLVTLDCSDGAITFYRKVSSEQDFDFLTFSIDYIQLDRWSGEVPWGAVSFPVTAGTHTFAWSYIKDSNTSAGLDTAWIDDILFPADGALPRVIGISPSWGGTVASSSVNVDVTFSEAVTGMNASDLVLSGTAGGAASVGTPTHPSGNTWRFPLSGLVNGTLNLALAQDTNDIEDTQGNDVALTAWSYEIHRGGGGTYSKPELNYFSSVLDSTISVPGPVNIADINVRIDLEHMFDAEVAAYLISPLGTQVELFTYLGGSGRDFTNTVLDDEAGSPITAGSAPFTGTFRPEGSLAAFDGQNGQGVWTLHLSDLYPWVNYGFLYSWSITITPSDLASPAVTVNSLVTDDPTPTLSGTATDASGVSSVLVTVNGSSYSATFGAGTWSVPVTGPLTPGTYNVEAQAADTYGNINTDVTTNELIVIAAYWSDFAWGGTELGTYTAPFNTLGEAVSAVSPGGLVFIKGNTASNTSPETLTITKPVRIEAIDGPVRIGASGAP